MQKEGTILIAIFLLFHKIILLFCEHYEVLLGYMLGLLGYHIDEIEVVHLGYLWVDRFCLVGC